MKVQIRSSFRVQAMGLSLCALLLSQSLAAQEAEGLEQILQRVPTAPPGVSLPPYPTAPLRYQSGEGMDIEVSVVTTGLHHPWGFAQLPDGSMLVSERNKGVLRLIRDGVLQPQPVAGVPAVSAGGFTGLLDVVLHPDFAANQLVYLTYNKPLADDSSAMAVYRARWNGSALQDGADVFVADAGVSGASRILFDKDGFLFISLYGGSEDAQDLAQQRGKVLRLTPDGQVPADNPFVNQAGARPEIWTLGHRTPQGLLQHPVSSEIWEMEMGPNGGDEINILQPGANYGWPYVSLGRDYAGAWQGELQRAGLVDPVVYWMPSISVSGFTFYTGDKLPAWQGDLLVGGLRMGEIPGTGQLQRIRFNALGQEIRREVLLADLRWRIKGAHQGSDGYLYVLTDEEEGAVLRIGAAD